MSLRMQIVASLLALALLAPREASPAPESPAPGPKGGGPPAGKKTPPATGFSGGVSVPGAGMTGMIGGGSPQFTGGGFNTGGMPGGFNMGNPGGFNFGGMPRQPFLLPKIKAGAKLAELLPPTPKAAKRPVYTGEELSRVLEVIFEERPGKTLTQEEWEVRTAHRVAAALHLNDKDEDGCLKALIKERPDLSGLPFTMGDACRTKGFRASAFKEQVEAVRPLNADQLAGSFSLVRHKVQSSHRRDKEKAEQLVQASMAAVCQVHGAAEGKMLLGKVRCLISTPRAEATRELARVAVFSPSAEAREEALEALAVRREADSAEVLKAALRYPWPPVAKRAAQAIARLDRKDLMPELVALLEEQDPRSPREEEIDGRKVTVARELVRVNHHHNCLLCHPPAERAKVAAEVFLAEMPLPTRPLGSLSQGYGRTESPLLVRIDVTYLRQDFSLMQETRASGVWPASQRFDFLVRKRPLAEGEARELHRRLEVRKEGVLSPYQKAAVHALREMTGRDFEPKAETWRRFLAKKES